MGANQVCTECANDAEEGSGMRGRKPQLTYIVQSPLPNTDNDNFRNHKTRYCPTEPSMGAAPDPFHASYSSEELKSGIALQELNSP